MVNTSSEDDGGKIMVALGGSQNKAWAEDTSKFGYKMLLKMGWKAGKGLGKELEGQATHVKIMKRTENLGLGCSLKQAETTGWSTTSKGFADILSELNQAYQEKNSLDQDKKDDKKKKKKKKKKKLSSDEEDEESMDRKKAKKEKKKKRKNVVEKVQPKRILYNKRISNKNAKGYSANDLSAILGHAHGTETSTTIETSMEETISVSTTKRECSTSIQETYEISEKITKKMKKKKAKSSD